MAKSHVSNVNLRRVQRLFALFGNSSRVVIFQRLARSPGTAGELAAHLPITRAGIVQHLKALQAAGLVAAHAEGRKRVYRITPSGLAPLGAWLATHS